VERNEVRQLIEEKVQGAPAPLDARQEGEALRQQETFSGAIRTGKEKSRTKPSSDTAGVLINPFHKGRTAGQILEEKKPSLGRPKKVYPDRRAGFCLPPGEGGTWTRRSRCPALGISVLGKR